MLTKDEYRKLEAVITGENLDFHDDDEESAELYSILHDICMNFTAKE